MTHIASGVFITFHVCLPVEFIFKFTVTLMVTFDPQVIIFRRKPLFDKKKILTSNPRSKFGYSKVNSFSPFVLSWVISIFCVVIRERVTTIAACYNIICLFCSDYKVRVSFFTDSFCCFGLVSGYIRKETLLFLFLFIHHLLCFEIVSTY